ncbi:MAG TPA: SpoIIE family protein phosphatase [Roseiflexaceae bacterium]|nr:SpoIIE family protein phosphatase [Roseiflexaceae bacterium]
MVELQVAVAKVPRHGAAESGDTLEMIERPGGGISVVLVDGQGSGRGAKTLSNLIATRAITQIKDGARDGVVARAVHDYLYTYRMGQVAATLNILSVDLRSGTILMSRNNPAPFFVLDGGEVHSHSEPSTPIGLHPGTKPRITEIPLRAGAYVVLFTDGLLKAGARYGQDLDIVNFLAAWHTEDGAPPLAEALLARALEAERGAPTDDMSVVVLAAMPARSEGRTRRMWVSLPVERPAPDDRREVDLDEDLG